MTPDRCRRPRLGAVVLVAVAAAVFVLVGVNVLTYVLARLGLGPDWMLVILLSSFLGSTVNVPLFRLRVDERPAAVELTWFGLVYRPPQRRTVVVAVNVGGAIVPTAMSVYLVVERGIALQALVAIAVVTAVVFVMAWPLDGVGIVVPMLLPPAAAAVTAIAVTAIVVGGPAVAALAYAAGTLGTLLGADILHLRRVGDLGADRVSIGGAGTFDGVFLTGIVAVLLATM